MQILKVFKYQEIIGSKNQKSLIQTNIKKDVTCSYGYKLVYVDDKFSKPFLPYVGEGAVYNFNNSMAEERKYCGAVMKKHFNKNNVITK